MPTHPLRLSSHPMLAALAVLGLLAATGGAETSEKPRKKHKGWYDSGLKWEEPPVVESPVVESPAAAPPSDAVVLFDGTDLSAWDNAEKWKVQDGVATVGPGHITTKQSFGDCQLHLEWSSPEGSKRKGQGRGNSGVYFMGKYEVQILDSYQNPTYFDGMAGAIYKQTPPLVNAVRPPGEWNAFDIVFTAPRFAEDGKLLSPTYLTVFCNGVLLQNHTRLDGETPSWRVPKYRPHAERLPLKLQDHGNPVRFRNIWLREIEPLKSERIHKPMLK